MKHFFDPRLGVRAFEEDGSQDFLITPDMRPLSEEELNAYLNPPKTEQQVRDELKASRALAVEKIKVTTKAGNTFDGDETSQGRMARAIIALNAAPAGSTVRWVLADNSVIMASAKELTEALSLAGAEQAAIWVME